MTDEHDPTAIRSLAVAVEDVLDAAVYNRENPGTAVLRVTPPFHGRMRARLHVYRDDDSGRTGAVHVAPSAFLPERAAESYPTFAERSAGADEGVRADRLDGWRSRARESLRDEVTIDVDGESHAISVAWLERTQ